MLYPAELRALCFVIKELAGFAGEVATGVCHSCAKTEASAVTSDCQSEHPVFGIKWA